MTLEERLREILADGECEALITVWIDEEGELIAAVNDDEPHFVVRDESTAHVEYHTEH